MITAIFVGLHSRLPCPRSTLSITSAYQEGKGFLPSISHSIERHYSLLPQGVGFDNAGAI